MARGLGVGEALDEVVLPDEQRIHPRLLVPEIFRGVLKFRICLYLEIDEERDSEDWMEVSGMRGGIISRGLDLVYIHANIEGPFADKSLPLTLPLLRNALSPLPRGAKIAA